MLFFFYFTPKEEAVTMGYMEGTIIYGDSPTFIHDRFKALKPMTSTINRSGTTFISVPLRHLTVFCMLYSLGVLTKLNSALAQDRLP